MIILTSSVLGGKVQVKFHTQHLFGEFSISRGGDSFLPLTVPETLVPNFSAVTHLTGPSKPSYALGWLIQVVRVCVLNLDHINNCILR